MRPGSTKASEHWRHSTIGLAVAAADDVFLITSGPMPKNAQWTEAGQNTPEIQQAIHGAVL